MISTKDNAEYIEKEYNQTSDKGDWLEVLGTTVKMRGRLLDMEDGTSSTKLMFKDESISAGDKVTIIDSAGFVSEITLPNSSIEEQPMTLVKEDSSSGTFKALHDGVMDFAISGGAGGGKSRELSNSARGGGGCGLVVKTGINISKGQQLEYIIGRGGDGDLLYSLNNPRYGSDGEPSSFNGTTTGYGQLGGNGADGGGNGGSGRGASGTSGNGWHFSSIGLSENGIPGVEHSQARYGGGGGGVPTDYWQPKSGADGGGGGAGGSDYEYSDAFANSGAGGHIFIAAQYNVKYFQVSLAAAPSKIFTKSDIDLSISLTDSGTSWTVASKTSKTFDGTNFLQSFAGMKKRGRKFQRKLVAQQKDVTITEPLTTQMKHASQ